MTEGTDSSPPVMCAHKLCDNVYLALIHCVNYLQVKLVHLEGRDLKFEGDFPLKGLKKHCKG